MAADAPVWILSRGRKGDLDQMLALATALGLPFAVKTLRFMGPEIPVLARLLLRAMPGRPWPRLVLCAEASPSVIARHMRKASGGAVLAVCIGRPAGSPAGFDLVITSAQYRIGSAPNVIELAMPISPHQGGAADPLPAAGPVALVVGGPAFPDRLDAGVAGQLAAAALDHAARRGRTLAVVTSPRTPPGVVAVLERAIMPPHRLHVFGRGENRYRAVLAEASEIVVTSDSVSMVADALSSGRPAAIYPLPRALNITWRLGEWLHRHAVAARHPLLRPVAWAFDAGLIEAAADRRALFARLVAERRLAWFGADAVSPDPGAAARDLATAVTAVNTLLKGKNDAST